MPQWLVRAAEWSVFLPIWRRATQMRWLRVVAACGIGLIWFIAVLGTVGAITGSHDNKKEKASAITTSTPSASASVSPKASLTVTAAATSSLTPTATATQPLVTDAPQPTPPIYSPQWATDQLSS